MSINGLRIMRYVFIGMAWWFPSINKKKATDYCKLFNKNLLKSIN